SFSAYAPGSEHADISHAGSAVAVIVPPSGSDVLWSAAGKELSPLSRGSQHLAADFAGLTQLRSLLERLFANAGDAHWTAGAVVKRSVAEELSSPLTRLLQPRHEPSSRGRPQIPRPVIVRRITEILNEHPNKPLFSVDLAAAVGISQQSLQRIFL